jgi:hypothetical protein
MRRASTALALVLFAAAPARAESLYSGDGPVAYYDSAADNDPDRGLTADATVGFLIGEQPVGRIVGTAIGFQLDGALHLGRFAAIGGYRFLSLTEDAKTHEPAHAYIHRVGASLRYSLGRVGTDDHVVRGDFWLEGGIGRQFVVWREGGHLGRMDATLAIAGQIRLRYGENKKHKAGLYYAARFLFSDRPGDKMLPSTCGGPCDAPSNAFPIDIGIYFEVGVPFR